MPLLRAGNSAALVKTGEDSGESRAQFCAVCRSDGAHRCSGRQPPNAICTIGHACIMACMLGRPSRICGEGICEMVLQAGRGIVCFGECYYDRHKVLAGFVIMAAKRHGVRIHVSEHLAVLSALAMPAQKVYIMVTSTLVQEPDVCKGRAAQFIIALANTSDVMQGRIFALPKGKYCCDTAVFLVFQSISLAFTLPVKFLQQRGTEHISACCQRGSTRTAWSPPVLSVCQHVSFIVRVQVPVITFYSATPD